MQIKIEQPKTGEQMNLDLSAEKTPTRAEMIQDIRGKMFNGEGKLTEEEEKFKKDNPDLFDTSDDQVRFN